MQISLLPENIVALPYVFLPVLGTKSQVLVQPCPHIVPVQPVGGDPLRYQILLQGKGQGRLARPGQAGEPDGAAAEPAVRPQHFAAAVARDGVLLEGDVGGLLHVPGAPGGDGLLMLQLLPLGGRRLLLLMATRA
jgi:hypothetical protein